MWLRIGAGSRLLWISEWVVWFHKMRRISWLPSELLDATKDSAPWIERMSAVRECVSYISNEQPFLILLRVTSVKMSFWLISSVGYKFTHSHIKHISSFASVVSDSRFKTRTLGLFAVIARWLVSAFVLSWSDVHKRFCWERKHLEDLGADRRTLLKWNFMK